MASETDGLEQQLESLCLGCGMCCDGTFFECLALDQEERDIFYGLPLIAIEKDVGVNLPCVMHNGGRCCVYRNRPRRCVSFKCKVYVDVEAGTLQAPAAAERVSEFKRLVAELEADLGWSPGSFSTRRFRTWASEYPAGEERARKDHPEAFLKYGLTRLLFQRHFSTK